MYVRVSYKVYSIAFFLCVCVCYIQSVIHSAGLGMGEGNGILKNIDTANQLILYCSITKIMIIV